MRIELLLGEETQGAPSLHAWDIFRALSEGLPQRSAEDRFRLEVGLKAPPTLVIGQRSVRGLSN